MITRLRYPKGYQFFDANGAPLGLGALSYYVAGTTTPQDTYSDSAGAVVNTNPVILDGSGRLEVDVYLGSTENYKEVLASASATVSPWPDDNIPFATQADWNAPSGPNQILNKPALAAVATSGSYTDLFDTPSAFTGDAGTGGTPGLVPAPAAGDALANRFLSAVGAWATPPGASGSAATNLSITETADAVGIGSSSGTGVMIQAATLTAAGVLDAARAAKIDGLAAVAASGSYTDLANKPGNMTAATLSAAGQVGLVPAPAAGQNELFLRGDATWAAPTGSTNLGCSGTGDSISVTSSTGTGITIGAATAVDAGVLDSTRAVKIDNLAAVAASGSYTDLSNKPSIPSIPSSLSGQDIDNVARLGINTTDTSNLFSVNAPSVLFSNAGDVRATISKGGATNIAALNFQDNFSTRVQFGLLGNDSFTIATSPDGGTFKNAIVATTAGAVSFPNTGGFTGDAGSGGDTGLVPAPAAGTSAAGKFLKADGTWSVPAGTATVMTGATSSTAGSSGFAPAPVAGQQVAFLRGDGAWQQMTPAQISGLSPSATVDTTNAMNITAGTLAAARVGDLSATYALNSQKGANGGIATLDGSGKLTVSQIPASLVGAVVYQGTWNASANTPTLASGAGTKGHYYKVSVAGTAAIDGNSQWNVGDIIIFNGTAWDKIDGISNEVVSVAGLYGVISASGLKTALSISPGDVTGLGSLATQSTVNLASQAVSGSFSVALNAAANTSLSLPASGTLATTAQLNAGSISGLAASATTDTTNASNIASGTLPAARLPNPSTSALGGVQSATASANQFMTGINTSGVPLFAQPSASNISGLGALASQSAVNLSSQVTGALAYSSLSGAPNLGSLASLSSVNNANWSGTPLSTANGGTGQTTAAAAFNALSPMTEAGDMICGGASGAGTRLPAGNTSQVLIGGTVPSWGAVDLGSMVTGSLPAAGVSGLAASATTDTTNASNITSGTLAAAQLPSPASNAPGGVKSLAATSHKFLTAIGTDGGPVAAQPAASDISGLGTLATQSSVDLSSQAVSGPYQVGLTASANTTLALPKEGTLLTSLSTRIYDIKHDRSGDFADLSAAVAYLDLAMPLQGVTLSLDAGQHSYSSAIYIGHNWLKGALIQGVAPIAVSVTSIASSSGSPGAWSVVLNVSSTAGITTSMYAAIHGASGGTNPTFIEGVWPITAVDSGTITVSSTHRATAAPSGTVTASVGVLSTILKFTGCDGLQVWGGASAINLSNVVLVGDGSTHDGISLQDLGRINSAGIVAVTGFGHYGAYLCLGSEMNGAYLIASGNGSHGVCVDTKSVLDITAEIISSGNGGTGILADEASAVRGQGTSSITLTGNVGDGGYAVNNAIIDPVGAGYSTGNGGYGWHAELGGRIARNADVDGNNTLGYRALLLPVSYGSLIATPAGGNFEWDGAGLYCSPTSGVRGLVPVYQCSRVIAAGGKGLNNDATAQSFLPTGAQNFPVQAGAIYRFRAKVLLNTGNSNSRTVSSLFATGGGAAFSWISYSTKAYGSPSMGNMNFDWVSVMNASSARTMTSFNSYVWYELQMEGEFVMSSGGTIQPQIQFSAAPGGTNVNMQGSYFELYTYGYGASSVGLS